MEEHTTENCKKFANVMKVIAEVPGDRRAFTESEPECVAVFLCVVVFAAFSCKTHTHTRSLKKDTYDEEKERKRGHVLVVGVREDEDRRRNKTDSFKKKKTHKSEKVQ